MCPLFATAQRTGLTSKTSETSETSEKDTPTFTFSTSANAGVVAALAQEEESNINPGMLKTEQVGRALGKIRLRIRPRTAGRQRTWIVSGRDLARRAQSYGLPPPESLADSTLDADDEFEPLLTSGEIT